MTVRRIGPWRRIGEISFGLALTVVIVATAPLDVKGWADDNITQDEAVAIAQDAALRYGYKIASMKVHVYGPKEAWARYRSTVVDYDPAPQQTMNQLRGRQFWVVYLEPPPSDRPITGGDVYILVDADTGTVLALFRGA